MLRFNTPRGEPTLPDDGIKRPWPLDTATMEADLVDLASRRPDLSDWQRTELYLSAAFRFRDLDTGDAALPEQRAIFAWIDIVSPPEARATTQKQSPMERLVRMLIGRDTDRLLVGPDPPTTAAPLAALADKRPDLSVVQRHELLIAALGSLGRMDKGRRVEATNDAIFAWINVVVPVPAPVPDDRTLGEVKRLAPSLDDLEDRIHNLRQQRRLQDHLDALEADEALETLISRPSQARSGGSIPERHTRAAKQAAASRRTEPVVGRRGADEADQSESAEEQAAAQLEASARRMIAVWAGHPKVVTLVEHLRPDFRALLDQLAIDTDDRLPAAARILGMWPIVPGGTAWPNFFLNWPAEYLEAQTHCPRSKRTTLVGGFRFPQSPFGFNKSAPA